MRLACERHARDLADPKCEYEFRPKEADKAVGFIELLPHIKDRWAAQKQLLLLEPWQRFIVRSLFGWFRKADGIRRFREAYIEVPRKNGKSTLAAGIGLKMLLADGVYGAEVYSGATTERQAWEVFRPARLMAKNTPSLAQAFGLEVNAQQLIRMSDGARFEPLVGRPGDGASPSCAIVDEFHEHETPILFDTMLTGMGSRENPLMLVITTAGVNTAGPCYEKRLEVQRMLSGTVPSDRLFGIIWTLDEGDDWTDPKVWPKANPNLGVSLSKDYMEAQVAQAVRMPSKQNIVRCKHFNQWMGARSAWLNMEQWNACGDPTLDRAQFAGDPCYVGLDLATRVDIAARVDLYTREQDGRRHYYAFPTLYVPEGALGVSKNSQAYTSWIASGHLQSMEGDEIDLVAIQEELLALAGQVQIKELVYDPWQSSQLAQACRSQGIETVEFRHTVANMSPGMRELEAAVASNRFHHPANACLTWMAGNVVAKADAKDNIYPRKDTADAKIDGIVAAIMAVGRAATNSTGGSMTEFLEAWTATA